MGFSVTIRNVCSILASVAVCEIEDLKVACLRFICLNLEAVLRHRYVEASFIIHWEWLLTYRPVILMN